MYIYLTFSNDIHINISLHFTVVEICIFFFITDLKNEVRRVTCRVVAQQCKPASWQAWTIIL